MLGLKLNHVSKRGHRQKTTEHCIVGFGCHLRFITAAEINTSSGLWGLRSITAPFQDDPAIINTDTEVVEVIRYKKNTHREIYSSVWFNLHIYVWIFYRVCEKHEYKFHKYIAYKLSSFFNRKTFCWISNLCQKYGVLYCDQGKITYWLKKWYNDGSQNTSRWIHTTTLHL